MNCVGRGHPKQEKDATTCSVGKMWENVHFYHKLLLFLVNSDFRFLQFLAGIGVYMLIS